MERSDVSTLNEPVAGSLFNPPGIKDFVAGCRVKSSAMFVNLENFDMETEDERFQEVPGTVISVFEDRLLIAVDGAEEILLVDKRFVWRINYRCVLCGEDRPIEYTALRGDPGEKIEINCTACAVNQLQAERIWRY